MREGKPAGALPDSSSTDPMAGHGSGAFGGAAHLAERLLAHPATQWDIDAVTAQLGRYPRGMIALGRMDVLGRPLAVVTRPILPGNIPFPTTCYLTEPGAVKAVSRLEAQGAMREYARMLDDDPKLSESYNRAHERYLEFRHALAVRLGDDERRIAGVSAGGMPNRVKCLHALVAQALVMGPGVNPIGDAVIERLRGQIAPARRRA